MTSPTRARAWRQSRNLSIDDLAELTGYSAAAISLMERGLTGRSKGKWTKIRPYAWQRYRMACAGAEAQLKTKKEFNW